MLEFGLYKDVAEVSWAPVCNERIIRKHISTAVFKPLKPLKRIEVSKGVW